MTVVTSEVFFMPLLGKAIISHCIVIVFLTGLIIYFILKPPKRWLLWVILPVVIPVFFYFCYSFYAIFHTRFEMTSDGLLIVSGFHRSRFHREVIREVSVPDSDLKPMLRSFGLSLPGYKRGRFQLRNNERGLVFLTAFQNAVCVRTHDCVILLSVESPERFVNVSKRCWSREE